MPGRASTRLALDCLTSTSTCCLNSATSLRGHDTHVGDTVDRDATHESDIHHSDQVGTTPGMIAVEQVDGADSK